MIRKCYQVAGHRFAVEMPEGFPLWGAMGQYAPFEVEDGTSIFSLELVRSLPGPVSQPVYAGGENPDEPLVRLYREPDAWFFEVAPCAAAPVCGQVRSNLSFTQASFCLCREGHDALFALNNALMLLFAFRTASEGTLELHASVVRCRDRAFLFLAPSGTGKSTHSSLWLKHIPGSSLLNDDNPVVRLRPDGGLEVYGSPWSGKTPCYKNEHVPIGAFVQIRRSAENRIQRLSLFESYALLYSSSSGFKSDPEMADNLHATFERILKDARCFALDCRPDEEAARVCAAAVLEDLQ